jgi:hypothetical protein
LNTVSSRLPRSACLVEVRAVSAADFSKAVDDTGGTHGSLRHVPGPALAAGLFNWPHYGHALGNSLFGMWATLVEHGLAGPGACGGHGCATRALPVYVRACGQGQAELDANDTTADGGVSLASTSLAPAFHALAGPGRRPDFRSWTAAVADSSATPLLFHHLIVGLTQAADQYNDTLDGRLLRALGERVADEVGTEQRTRASPVSSSPPSHHAAAARKSGLRSRRSVSRPQLRTSPNVLVIHRGAGSRVIANEAALVDALDTWARAQGGRARAVSFEQSVALADVVDMMRRPAWSALIGVDGTGLLNAVWARPGCGAAVRLATWGAKLLMPTKGANFDRVALATLGASAVWECENRACARPEPMATTLAGVMADVVERNDSTGVSTLTFADKWEFVTRQGVHVDVVAVVKLVDGAWDQRRNGVCGAVL